MIVGKIDLRKVDQSKVFKGEKGDYLEIAIIENKNGPGKFGDTHMIVQGTTKQERENGIRGAIIGNAKELAAPGSKIRRPESHECRDVCPGDSEIPF